MPTVSAQANARNDRLIRLAVCVFLTAIIWIVFGQTLRHGFVNFDDDRYVYENSHITAGLTLDGARHDARAELEAHVMERRVRREPGREFGGRQVVDARGVDGTRHEIASGREDRSGADEELGARFHFAFKYALARAIK